MNLIKFFGSLLVVNICCSYSTVFPNQNQHYNIQKKHKLYTQSNTFYTSLSSIADGEFSYDSSESVQIGINDDNSASILDCNVNSISVNNLSFHSSFIDSDGVTHPITIIGESAFSSQTESFVPDISGKVSFPNSIISIGKNAFYKCQKITELDIIDATSLTYIDAGAFAKCIGISGKISFPSSLQQIYDNETSYGSFYQCRNITELDFSMCENLKSIGSYSFFGCSSISNDIYFPKTLETIGSYSFSQCSSLRSINFPSDSSLKTIDDSAFSECKLLSIPDFSPCLNLLLIGNSSFYDCSNMIGVLSIPVNIKTIGVSAFSKTNINYLWLYWDVSELSTITLGYNCFPMFYDKNTIHIPNGATDYQKFFEKFGLSYNYDCFIISSFVCKISSILKNEIDPSQDVDITCEMNEDGTGVSILNISSSFSCDSLIFKDTVFNDADEYDILHFSNNLFKDLTNITGKVVFPKKIISLGQSCFENCSGITSIDFSESHNLTKIFKNCFANCVNIHNESIYIPSSITTFQTDCFKNSGIFDSIIFNWNSIQIENITIQNDDSLPTLSNESKDIGSKIIVPVACTQKYIDWFLSKGLYKYSNKDFYEDISMWFDLAQVCDYVHSGIGNVKVLCEFNKSNYSYSIVETEVEANLSNNFLIIDPKFYQNLVYEDMTYTLIGIGDESFKNSTYLYGSITFPDSLTYVGKNAFLNSSIDSIKFLDSPSLNTLGDYCFYNCKNLKNIFTAKLLNLSYIGDSSFGECSNLSGDNNDQLFLSSRLYYIGLDAFLNVKPFKTIFFSWTQGDLIFQDIVIKNINSLPNIQTNNSSIVVPYNTKQSYVNFFRTNNFLEKYPEYLIVDDYEPIVPDSQDYSIKDYLLISFTLTVPFILILSLLLFFLFKKPRRKNEKK